MPQADGSIVISTEIDDKKAQQQLNTLTKKIDKIKTDLSTNKEKQSGIEKQLQAAKDEALKTEQTIKRLETELKQAQAITSGQVSSTPTQYIETLEKQEQITAELKKQQEILAGQDKETERIDREYTKITDKVIQQTQELEKAETEAGGYAQQLMGASDAAATMSPALDEAAKRMDKLTNRIKKLASRVFVFTLITSALRSVRSWLWDCIKTNDEAVSAIANLKGALLTLAQPLVNVIIPAFTAFVNVLTKIVSAIAALLSKLFGTTVESSAAAAESLYNESNALEDTADAAEEAASSLAGFDEINQISTETASSSDTSSGTSTDTIAPNFNWLDSVTDKFDGLLDVVETIGAAILGWKLSQALLSGLEMLTGTSLSKNLKLGIALSAAGVGVAAQNVAAILNGEYEAASLESGIKEAISGALIGAGAMAMGAGGWAIPAALSLVVAVTEIIVNWDNITSMWSNIWEGIKSLFTGDTEGFWDGMTQAFYDWATGDSWMVEITRLIVDGIFGEGYLAGVLEWIEGGGSFGEIAAQIWSQITGAFAGIGNWFSEHVIEPITSAWSTVAGWFSEHVTGPISSAFSTAWETISGVWATVSSWFMNTVITPISNFFSSAWAAISGFFITAWETIKGAWSTAVSWFNAIVTPIREKFEEVAAVISAVFEGCWIIIQAVWKFVSEWFMDTVITPLTNFFSSAWTAISGFFISAWNTIKGVWATVSSWFLNTIINPIKNAFSVAWTAICGFFTSAWNTIKGVWATVSSWFVNTIITPLKTAFTTVVNTIANLFTTLWSKIKSVFSSVASWFNEHIVKPIKSAFQTVVNFVKGIFNGLIGIIESLLNSVINAINKFTGGFSSVVQKAANFIGVDWDGIPTISTVTLPRLAQGAVIPPNREFLAVLGDQSSGNNIEAPESLIRQIVREETGGNNNAEVLSALQSILQALQDGQVIKVNETILGRTTARAINKASAAAGSTLLVV